jgi:hypothetical protein
LEWAKTVHALDHAAIVIYTQYVIISINIWNNFPEYKSVWEKDRIMKPSHIQYRKMFAHRQYRKQLNLFYVIELVNTDFN